MFGFYAFSATAFSGLPPVIYSEIGGKRTRTPPADELIKIHTGDAFDLIDERKRINFRVETANSSAKETFEITLRNRKKDSVTIRVIGRRIILSKNPFSV